MMEKIKLCAAAAVASCFVAQVALAANIAVIGGRADDAFFNPVKKGVDDARLIVEANGGKVTYLPLQSYDNLGPDAAALIRTAIAQGVDGIAVPDWVPEAEDEAIKAAVDAGIKVLLMNVGSKEQAETLSALNYIGSDDYLAGIAAGEYFTQKSYKNILCVNTVPGAANLEARCKGLAEGASNLGAKAKQLPLPASSFGDPTAVAEAVKASLLQDASIDGVLTISSADADSVATAILQAGKVESVALASVDFNEAGLSRIEQGAQLFAIDQQPYLFAFLSVTLLSAHLDFGTDLPVRPVLTGPSIIDASNVAATIVGTQKGAR